MKAVVTGGAGFIGSNLVEELLNLGCGVTVIDDLSTGRIENVEEFLGHPEFEFVEGSILDMDLLKRAFANADYVFHQAAISSVQRSVENPLATNETNITGTLNVLIAAKECGARKVIYASSCAVYGDSPVLPKKEDVALSPKSPYAVSKLTGEYYCRVFSEVYGLKTVSLRYFNVYGPKQNPDSEYAAVIPRFIARVLRGEAPVIFGDGNQTRDFVFVKDVVAANVLAMREGARGVFNVASGERVSINQLAWMIMDITQTSLEPVHAAPRDGDVRDSVADISLAAQGLGYQPSFDLNQGLEATAEMLL